MISLVVARKTIRDLRNVLAGIGFTVFAVAFLITLLYPEVAGQYEDIEFPEVFDVFFGDVSIGTPEGFIAAEFFSWIPLLIITMAIIHGTATIAGEEADGTLELLVAQPITRTSLIVAKTVAMALVYALMCLTGLPGLLLGRGVVPEFDLPVSAMLAATTAMVALTWFFLALSILASAALPTRSAAAVIMAAITVAAYLVNLVAPLSTDLEPLRWISPFYWADWPAILVDGMQWPIALLLGIAVIAVALAVVAFQRRDIGAASWPRLLLPRSRRAIRPAAHGEAQ